MDTHTNELIASYSRQPVGFHPVEQYTVSAKTTNSLCGDFVIVFLCIDDTGIITDFSYQGDPAMHTLAAASLLTEYIIGQSVQTVLTWGYTQMKERGFVVSTRRQRSAVTALVATRNAIHARLQDGKEDTYEDVLG